MRDVGYVNHHTRQRHTTPLRAHYIVEADPKRFHSMGGVCLNIDSPWLFLKREFLLAFSQLAPKLQYTSFKSHGFYTASLLRASGWWCFMDSSLATPRCGMYWCTGVRFWVIYCSSILVLDGFLIEDCDICAWVELDGRLQSGWEYLLSGHAWTATRIRWGWQEPTVGARGGLSGHDSATGKGFFIGPLG